MFKHIAATHMSIIKRNPVHGVGINNAPYKVTIKTNAGIEWCPYYKRWMDMMKRCYCIKYINKNPSYKRCFVAKEWHSFMVFRAWMEKQDWKGKELDKDIITPGNKEYSPVNCVFVPHRLNVLLTQNRVKSKLPAGVYFHKAAGKYCAELKSGLKKKYLGLYITIEDASKAYIKAKRAEIIKLALLESDDRIRHGLMLHADAL